MSDTILVTGGAGFIGSNFLLEWLATERSPVINLDKLTYAGNLRNLESISTDRRYTFVHGDIGDRKLVRQILRDHRPRAIVHFAAESHVDRSIRGPDDFIKTNVNGTFSLLEEARTYWMELPEILLSLEESDESRPIATPAPPLNAMTFEAEGGAEPTVVFAEKSQMKTP